MVIRKTAKNKNKNKKINNCILQNHIGRFGTRKEKQKKKKITKTAIDTWTQDNIAI